MGSGSFGGGSGSFGGGGSGGGGGGRGGGSGGGGSGRGGSASGSNGGSGGKGKGSRGKRAAGSGTDSAYDRILKLTKLTDSVNANPEIDSLRATISGLLRDRTRAAFLRATLRDAMVTSVYKVLLTLEAHTRGGMSANEAASKLGGFASATLADLTDNICQRGQAADTDERVETIVRRAVTDLLLRTVGNTQQLYYERPLKQLGTSFDRRPLENTADIFLSAIIADTVRRDLLNLTAEARAGLVQASRAIAINWTDKFKDRRQKTGTAFRDMMQAIGNDYAFYAGKTSE